MRMPNGHRAIVPDDKLFGYLLNESHPSQPGHAELFHTLLGLTPENGQQLRTALLNAALNADATEGAPSPHGQKYEIRFEMTGTRGVYTILSVWMIENGRSDPRLVTAFIE